MGRMKPLAELIDHQARGGIRVRRLELRSTRRIRCSTQLAGSAPSVFGVPSSTMPKSDDQFSDFETEKRRDAALLRALSTPHKRQAEMKIGKRKPKPEANASPKGRRQPPKERG